MNRQIKFRGLRKGDNTWLYGDLVHINGECHIFPEDAPNSPDYYEVIPESVGQFTGLLDKEGFEIFEGDIVRMLYSEWASKSPEDPRTIDQYLIDIASICEVAYHEDRFCIKRVDRYGDFNYSSIFPGTHGYIQVIGNIQQFEVLKSQSL